MTEQVASPAWRSQHSVLVPDAHTLGAIAVIRSLGRAGYRVHAASPDARALGLRSRYAFRGEVGPAYADPRYPDWVAAYCARHAVTAIIPSEAFLLAIRDRYGEFARLLPYSPDPAVVYAGMSKYDFFANSLAEDSLRGNMPPTLLADVDAGRVPSVAELEMLGTPVFVKTDTVHSRRGATGGVARCVTAAAARDTIERLGADFKRMLVQGYAPGAGVGAFFVTWGGRSLAEFTHIRVHEVPHTGGWSSYRRSFEHEAIMDDARRRLTAMRWDGPAMVEYRLDRSNGRFYLMELNGRFWGSLHLALYAGVDFPAILVDAFFGRERPGVVRATGSTSCRYTFPADVQHVASRLADPAVSTVRKVGSVAEFFALGLNPRVYSDLWFPGDRRLYLLEMSRFLRTLGGRFSR